MFPSRFFPDRMFAPRYFPKVGAAAVAPPEGSGEGVIYFGQQAYQPDKEKEKRRRKLRREDEELLLLL